MLEVKPMSVPIPQAGCGGAPCGPECRFAAPLAAGANGDYVWCRLRGAPRSTAARVECPWFSAAMRTAKGDADLE